MSGGQADANAAGVPVRCPRCGGFGFTAKAVSNTDTGLTCLRCGTYVILQQGDLYWNDDDGIRRHLSLKDEAGVDA